MTRRLCFLLVLATLTLAGCTLNNAPVPAGPVTTGLLPEEALESPPAAPSIEHGQTLYAAHCVDCHGLYGQGGTPLAIQLAALGAVIPDLSAASNPQTAFQVVTTGGAFMPAYVDLLDAQQRWDVANYLFNFSLPDTASVPQPPQTAPSQPNTLMGRIVNHSGSTLPAGLGVTLRGFTASPSGTSTEVFVRSTLADNTGTYRFEVVPLDTAGIVFQVSTHYARVTYIAYADAPLNGGSMILDLPVYDTTTDPDLLVIEHLGIVLRSQPGALHVTQVLAYRAAGDYVYITPEPVRGGEHAGIVIELPPGAYGLEFEGGQAGGRFIVDGTTIYDTQHVLPDARLHTVSLSYLLPLNASDAFVLNIPHAISTFNLLVQESYNEAAGVFSVAGMRAIGDEQFIHLTAHNLAPGTVTVYSSRPAAPVQVNTVSILIAVLSSGLLLAVIGILRQGRQRRLRRMARVLAQTEGQQAHLLREIAALDAAYQAGKLDRFAYELRRAAKKAELVVYLEHL